MKVLICCSNREEVSILLDSLQDCKTATDLDIASINHPKKMMIQSFSRDGMHIDFAILGNSSIEVSFHMGRILQAKKYHIALMIGFCTSLTAENKNGDLVNIINDKLGDLIYNNEHHAQNLYQMALLNSNEYPHFRGGFINMTNAYFNVFLDIKKVASITSSITYEKINPTVQEKIAQYKVSIETRNGLGFVYACLWNQQPFYQLRIVNYEIETEEYGKNSAEILSNEIIKILNLIK